VVLTITSCCKYFISSGYTIVGYGVWVFWIWMAVGLLFKVLLKNWIGVCSITKLM